jgi:pimeloyl-ACP methyl ester carboxylesterase
MNLNGREVDVQDSGTGPAVLFLPGSYSTLAVWRPIIRLLPPGMRFVCTSLCGYGGTHDPRTPVDFGIAHLVEMVRSFAGHIGQPLHLVGHSFGGTVALAAALSEKIPVASLALFEANPMPLVRDTDGGQIYRDTLHMSQAFEAAVHAGEADAPRRVIDFWGGTGAYARMPESVQAYCRQTAAVNVLDWHTDMTMPVTAQDLTRLTCPVLLVRGEHANAAMVQVTDVLHKVLPNVQHAVVPGAGHFLVTTHPAQCAQLLGPFLTQVNLAIQEHRP